MRNRTAPIARVVIRVVAVVLVVFLLVETVIRWLPPDKIVVTTDWDHDVYETGSYLGPLRYTTVHEQYTETFVASHDAATIQQIRAAFSDSGVVMLPAIAACHLEPSITYRGERYYVTFYWHGIPTQVWWLNSASDCGEWLRSSGGVPDLWGRYVPYNPPHIEHN